MPGTSQANTVAASRTGSSERMHHHRMSAITAKVFKLGNSQAIRLPKAWRLSTTTVQIGKTGGGLFILDPKAEAKRVKALAKQLKRQRECNASLRPSDHPMPDWAGWRNSRSACVGI